MERDRQGGRDKASVPSALALLVRRRLPHQNYETRSFQVFETVNFFANLRCKKVPKLFTRKMSQCKKPNALLTTSNTLWDSRSPCKPFLFLFFPLTWQWQLICFPLTPDVWHSCSKLFSNVCDLEVPPLQQPNWKKDYAVPSIRFSVMFLLLLFRKSRGDLQQRTEKKVFIYDKFKTI